MKRLVFFYLLAALAVIGCDPTFIGEVTSEGRFAGQEDGDVDGNDDGTEPPGEDEDDPEETGEDEPVPKTLYVTGVEYPEGTDWRKDIGYDIEGSKLFLMKDGERIVELDVGYDECVSVDADMHRCINGHLYTDFSTDDETVVMVDGEVAYRYSGREMIVSMCVHEGSIYTLTVPRDGSAGWKYRRNDLEIYSQPDGELIGGLYEDNGDVVFTYRYKNSSTYYMFVNLDQSEISFPSNPTDVFDVRRIDGRVNYISAKGSSLTAMEEDSLITTFGGYSMNYEPDLKIYYDGEDRFYVGTTGSVTGVWQEGNVSMQCDGTVAGFYLSGNSYICVIKDEENEPVSVCRSGETSLWNEATELIYDTCTATDGFSYVIGVINKTNYYGRPGLYELSGITNFNFDGVFTHVDYW